MAPVDNPIISPSSGKDENPKEKGFFNRPRAGGKTIWDWLNLLGILAIPLVVGAATLSFGIQQANLAQQQHEADQQSALDQERQATLVTYLNDMRDLLLNRGLLTSKSSDEIRVIARTETLSAMRQLDGKRNRFLLQFLQDAHLIGNVNDDIVSFEIADLSSINLNGADLRGAFLVGADLSGADLSGADLSGADLSGASLYRADLRGAFLVGADLSVADLRGADLRDAHLSGASLYRADLRDANLVQQQLDLVNTCLAAILPPGLTCHHHAPP